MRFALAWLLGTALFALGMWLADRWFWSQCSGLPTSNWDEVWICSSMFGLRIAVACLGGLVAGALARRGALLAGALAGLAGIAVVSLAYRPLVPFNILQALQAGLLYFVLPAMAAALAAHSLLRRKAP